MPKLEFIHTNNLTTPEHRTLKYTLLDFEITTAKPYESEGVV